MLTGFCWEKFCERNYLEELGFRGRIILKCVLRNRTGQRGQDSSGKVTSACKGDSETSSCLKFGEFLD
jgi:hypothetical protein